MRLLLDEDVPQPLLPIVRHLLREHDVKHVQMVGWSGKKDRPLFTDARSAGFNAVLTNDLAQFRDPDECRAIQRSGLHHISYELGDGLGGLALASAAVCAAIRPVVMALEAVSGQRIVRITSLAKRKRYTLTNPATNPPSPYWP